MRTLHDANNVCLVLEGTYPYVPGGVSSWVHDIVRSMPEQPFSLLHIGPRRGAYGAAALRAAAKRHRARRALSARRAARANARPSAISCARSSTSASARAARAPAHSSRTLAAIRPASPRGHRRRPADRRSRGRRPHRRPAAARRRGVRASSRGLSGVRADGAVPRLLLALPLDARAAAARCSRPRLRARACTTASRPATPACSPRSRAVARGRPLLLTEHGIYAREREHGAGARDVDAPSATPSTAPARRTTSPLRRVLVALLRAAVAGRVPPGRADRHAVRGQPREAARRRRRSAHARRSSRTASTSTRSPQMIGDLMPREHGAPLRVGFVGRVVPIKDVITFIKACRPRAARRRASPSTSSGPPRKTRRTRRAAASSSPRSAARTRSGSSARKPLAEIYSNLDVFVLTSFSRGSAARDPRGARGRHAGDRDRCRRVPRDARRQRPPDRSARPERHRHERRRARSRPPPRSCGSRASRCCCARRWATPVARACARRTRRPR